MLKCLRPLSMTLVVLVLSTSQTLSAESFEASIERDQYGVPHIYGATDADAAFGLAYAQAEDAWPIMEGSLPFFRGSAGLYEGREGAQSDYLVKWLDLWGTLDRDYEQVLSPEIRRYVEAFAEGFNAFIRDNPSEAKHPELLPITGKDIIAGHMLRHPLFYGFDGPVLELFGEERPNTVSKAPYNPKPKDPIGSNATAIAPSRTEDGSTYLIINSHQPLTGPVAWYEAHLQSGEGLDVMGGLFPGAPTIGVGFTKEHGWGATVNKPDLVDIYVLEMNPDDPNQYRLDGEWQNLEVSKVKLKLKLWGFFPWSVSREVLRSVHGPALRTDHGVYAIRYAGMDEMKQVEQWLAMNKAKNFEEWQAAIALNYIQSFNFVYANRHGDIHFIHNAQLPMRAPNWQWDQYLPGDRSDLIWDAYHPTSSLPQVTNPSSGFVHSANQTPFNITAASDNPRQRDVPANGGWQTRMTNRATRGLELFEDFGEISFDEAWQLKHDNSYSINYRGIAFLQQVTSLPKTSDRIAEAIDILSNWDRATDKNNRGAALGVCVLAAEWQAESGGSSNPDPQPILDDCIEQTLDIGGRLDPRWGDVNRHGRDDTHWPVAGGPDTLRAIYSRRLDGDDHLTAVAGDGLYYLIRWMPDGDMRALGTHQYGNDMTNPDSSHYLDQAEDFTNEVLHQPLYSDQDRIGRITRRYDVRSD
ncbi:MAG: penicillin acylase family protein [Luminiphilus sp.]|nr:penicillin acylase family protein [Luminiphilus sp.]MBL6900832.1 penicillin acylase family protein [Luminiphilus sp.]